MHSLRVFYLSVDKNGFELCVKPEPNIISSVMSEAKNSDGCSYYILLTSSVFYCHVLFITV